MTTPNNPPDEQGAKVPTEPGYYWFQGEVIAGEIHRTEREPVIVERNGEGEFYFIGDECGYQAEDFHGQWQGPLSPTASTPVCNHTRRELEIILEDMK